MKAAIRGFTLVFLLVPPFVLQAQADPLLPEGRPPEWGIAAGYGFRVDVNRGTSEEQVVLFEPSVGFRLGSRFEYLAEAHFAQYLTPKGYMVGVMPLGGRVYIGRGRTLPYASIGAGLGWTNLTQLDEIDRRFNFLLQASAGVRGALKNGQGWTAEVRLAHISNGGTAEPNQGLNCVVFLFGWRFR